MTLKFRVKETKQKQQQWRKRTKALTDLPLYQIPYYVTFSPSSLPKSPSTLASSLANAAISGRLSTSSISTTTATSTPTKVQTTNTTNNSCRSPFSSTLSSLFVAHASFGSSISHAIISIPIRSLGIQLTRGSVLPLDPTLRIFISLSSLPMVSIICLLHSSLAALTLSPSVSMAISCCNCKNLRYFAYLH